MYLSTFMEARKKVTTTMQKIAVLLQISALIALSAFSEAFLFIALVMVKFWQSLAPQDFLNWMTNDLYLMPKIMVPLNREANYQNPVFKM